MNIQWRFQQPVEFQNINDRINTNKQAVEGAVKLGVGIHDYLLDRKLSNMMDENQQQEEIDASNQEQMNKEIALIKEEIQKLQNEKEQLNAQLDALYKTEVKATDEATSFGDTNIQDAYNENAIGGR